MVDFASKILVPINGVSVTNGATSSCIIDRQGWNQATIDVILSAADVATNSPSVLKLQESDTTVASSFVDITGFRGGTDFTIPAANTVVTAALQNVFRFNANCSGGARKRYLQAVVTPRTTQIVTIVANLTRGEVSPVNAVKANVLALIEG